MKRIVLMLLMFFLVSCGAVTPAPTVVQTLTPSLALPTKASVSVTSPTLTPRPTTLIPRPTPALIASWPDLHDGWTNFVVAPSVYSVVYDPHGYFWATTSNRGLYRWNIETSAVNRYTEADGLPTYFFDPIYYDGKIWVFSYGGDEAAYFLGDQWISQATNFGSVSKVIDTGNRLWVVGKDHLYYLDGSDWKIFDSIPKEYQGNVYQIARSKDDSLWFFIGSNQEPYYKYVLRFDGKTWENQDNLMSAREMLTTSDGILWFVFVQSLVSFDGQQFTPLVLPGNYYDYDVSGLLLTSAGDLWLPVDQDNVFVIHDNHVKKQALDGFGTLPEHVDEKPTALISQGWVFKGQNAIYLNNEKTWKKYGFVSDDTPLTQLITEGNSRVVGFTPDGALWVWRAGKLVRFDGTRMEQPSNSDFYSDIATFDSRGVLWGSYVGSPLLRFVTPGQSEITTIDLHYPINDFSIAPDGSIWLAFQDGFIANLLPDIAKNKGYQNRAKDQDIFVDLDKIKIDGKKYPNSSFEPSRIVVAPDGLVWVFVPKFGLYSYDGKNWLLHNETMFLLNGSAFAVDAKNQVWLAAEKLVTFNGRKWIKYPYPFRSGDVIQANKLGNCFFPTNLTIAADDSVWFTAQCGDVFRFDGKDWTRFDKDKELAGIKPSKIMLAPDGALWFFSDSGWARYKP